MSDDFVLALHGGAFQSARDYSRHTQTLETILKSGWQNLADGASALDAVTQAVIAMEQSGLFIAGKGAGPNSEGEYELDASIMEGHAGKAGAVAAVRGVKSPILAARAVMEKTPHVLLAGTGADRFIAECGLERIEDPQSYFTPSHTESQVPEDKSHGTVGAVALDKNGRLAAATSTGGLVGKRAGRVGDSPIIGAATWADRDLAVSTTGYGEYFIRAAAAYDIRARCAYRGEPLQESAGHVLDGIHEAGGWGGVIALNKNGEITLDYRCMGMHRGFVRSDGKIYARSLPEA